MKLLILGGTRFLGRFLTELALERDYEVTLFNRGLSNPELFPEVETLIGDRTNDADLSQLKGRSWDAVVDTCGYVPGVVRQSALLLKDLAQTYAFISTISVYKDFSVQDINEQAEVSQLADESIEEVTGETYGPLKALCEQEVIKAFPTSHLVVRPGLLVGPHDPTDRFTYWPYRFAQGGEVLVPDRQEAQVQFVDCRDLAQWTLDQLEQHTTGIFNVTGPEQRISFGQFLQECQRIGGHRGSPPEQVGVTEAFLNENEVGQWVELPFWLNSESNMAGMLSVNITRGLERGLTFRPLEETIQDTLDWAETRGAEYVWKAGLTLEKEKKLLKLWHARN